MKDQDEEQDHDNGKTKDGDIEAEEFKCRTEQKKTKYKEQTTHPTLNFVIYTINGLPRVFYYGD